MQLLAADLACRLPWLVRGHLGSLYDALTVPGLDSTVWTARDVSKHLDADNSAAGRGQPAPGDQRNPVGLCLVQAQRAVGREVSRHPTVNARP